MAASSRIGACASAPSCDRSCSTRACKPVTLRWMVSAARAVRSRSCSARASSGSAAAAAQRAGRSTSAGLHEGIRLLLISVDAVLDLVEAFGGSGQPPLGGDGPQLLEPLLRFLLACCATPPRARLPRAQSAPKRLRSAACRGLRALRQPTARLWSCRQADGSRRQWMRAPPRPRRAGRSPSQSAWSSSASSRWRRCSRAVAPMNSASGLGKPPGQWAELERAVWAHRNTRVRERDDARTAAIASVVSRPPAGGVGTSTSASVGARLQAGDAARCPGRRMARRSRHRGNPLPRPRPPTRHGRPAARDRQTHSRHTATHRHAQSGLLDGSAAGRARTDRRRPAAAGRGDRLRWRAARRRGPRHARHASPAPARRGRRA